MRRARSAPTAQSPDGESWDGLGDNGANRPNAYTVIGLVDNDSGEFIVAGVLAGKHNTADSGPSSGGYGQYTRYADPVEADNADNAAELVTEALAAGDDHQGDNRCTPSG